MGASIGVQTSHSARVSPIISVVLIAGGIALTVAGAPDAARANAGKTDVAQCSSARLRASAKTTVGSRSSMTSTGSHAIGNR